MTRKRRPDGHSAHDTGTSMRVYRWAWLLVCAILAGVGIAVLLIVFPAVLVFLFLAFAVVGVVVILAGADDPAATRAPRLPYLVKSHAERPVINWDELT